MGRRLTQRDLLALLAQVRGHLWQQVDTYPWPSLDVDRETYLQHTSARSLLLGRWHGASQAYAIVMEQRRWGPVSQARAHDGLMDVANQVWRERDAHIAEQRTYQVKEAFLDGELEREANHAATGRQAFWNTMGERERDIAAGTSSYTGQLDALRAASRAIAGYPERLQALVDLEHPEQARMLARSRERDHGIGE